MAILSFFQICFAQTASDYLIGAGDQFKIRLNALSSACQAIFLAGGPSKHAAFRDIKIIRKGKTVAQLDLYKFLMDGERSQDRALRYGDTIFVPQNLPQ